MSEEINNPQDNSQEIKSLISEITAKRTKKAESLKGKEQIVTNLESVVKDFKDVQIRLKANTDTEALSQRDKVVELKMLQELNLESFQVEIKGKSETINLDETIKNYRKEFNRLHGRLTRPEIQITLMGKARQGKSTIIQAITGLDDRVIPSSSGTDCTGAVSIVHHWNKKDEAGKYKFHMDVEYYTQEEFIDAVQKKLDEILGDKAPRINCLSDIKNIREDLFDTEHKKSHYYFYRDYVEQYNLYQDCLTGNPETEFEDENVVAEYVAKYITIGEDETIPEKYKRKGYKRDKKLPKQLTFAKYVTVKKAVIYTHFPFDGADKIVVVDTVGLGNKIDLDGEEKRLYEDVLPNDTDIAIFNFKTPDDGVNQETSEEPQYVVDKLDKLKDLDMHKWISVFVNHKAGKSDIASSLAWDISNGLNDAYDETFYVKPIDAVNKKQVIEEFLKPLLTNTLANLDAIDDMVATKLSKMGEILHAAIKTLKDLMDKAQEKMQELDPEAKSQFEDNWANLHLRLALEEYKNELKKESEKPSTSIASDLKPIFEEIEDLAPTPQQIITHLQGQLGNGYADITFHHFVDKVYAEILAKLKSASSKSISNLEAEIKDCVAKILKEDGKLGQLSIANLPDKATNTQWLELFCKQRLTKYPVLKGAVESVLNYRMGIDGFIYHSCITACERMAEDFPNGLVNNNMNYQQKAVKIYAYIADTLLRDIRKTLEEQFGIKDSYGSTTQNQDLSLPNKLKWCVVDTFYRECYGGKGVQELKDGLYWEYRDAIWKEDVAKQKNNGALVKEYNQLHQKLENMTEISNYIFNIQ